MTLRAKRRPTSKTAWAILIGLLAAAAGWGVHHLPVVERWEFSAYDLRAQWLARPSPSADRIRLVYLDQPSLDWGEDENKWKWPWPREIYAALTDYFTAACVKSLNFDVIFSEDSFYGVEDDAAFGTALASNRRANAALVLSGVSRKSMASVWPDSIPRTNLRSVPGEARPALAASFPILAVATNVAGLGTVNMSPDRDGIFRSMNIAREFDGTLIPSLGAAAFLTGGGAARDLAASIPVRADGSVLLRFPLARSGPPAFSVVPILRSQFQIQEGGKPDIPPSEFKDCHVFFGFSAEGLKDLRPTPMDPVAPGTTLHATLLDNLLSNRFIREIPDSVWGPVAALLAALCAGWALFNSSWRGHVPTIATALLVPWGLGFAAYAAGAWWPVIPGLIASISATAAGILFNYATEGRQKAFIQQAFSHYLSPVVIDRLVKDPDQLQLGGEKKELTIFFSDLAGFSSFSERLNPTQLTAMLNEYLTAMTDIILGSGGTLDKYEGDAIIAFWNAPLSQADHAVRAVRAAIRCQEKLDELRPRFQEMGGVDLRMRIGINTGEVVVGNFGSRERFNYTVLGDAANLASRLEGANKVFGTYLMVSEAAWKQLGDTFPGRLLARLRVVGRSQAVPVYEPFAGTAPAEDVLRRYAEGLALLEAGDLAAALQRFEENTGDPPSGKHAAAIRQWMKDPASFDKGIWNLTSK